MDHIYGIGDRIKAQRVKRKMSQKQLADRLALTQSTISSYESEQTLPSKEILYQLAVIFDCTTDYLLGLNSRRFICVDNLSAPQEDALRRLVDVMDIPIRE